MNFLQNKSNFSRTVEVGMKDVEEKIFMSSEDLDKMFDEVIKRSENLLREKCPSTVMLALDKFDDIEKMINEGMSPQAIADEIGIGKENVYIIYNFSKAVAPDRFCQIKSFFMSRHIPQTSNKFKEFVMECACETGATTSEVTMYNRVIKLTDEIKIILRIVDVIDDTYGMKKVSDESGVPVREIKRIRQKYFSDITDKYTSKYTKAAVASKVKSVEEKIKKRSSISLISTNEKATILSEPLDDAGIKALSDKLNITETTIRIIIDKSKEKILNLTPQPTQSKRVEKKIIEAPIPMGVSRKSSYGDDWSDVEIELVREFLLTSDLSSKDDVFNLSDTIGRVDYDVLDMLNRYSHYIMDLEKSRFVFPYIPKIDYEVSKALSEGKDIGRIVDEITIVGSRSNASNYIKYIKRFGNVYKFHEFIKDKNNWTTKIDVIDALSSLYGTVRSIIIARLEDVIDGFDLTKFPINEDGDKEVADKELEEIAAEVVKAVDTYKDTAEDVIFEEVETPSRKKRPYNRKKPLSECNKPGPKPKVKAIEVEEVVEEPVQMSMHEVTDVSHAFDGDSNDFPVAEEVDGYEVIASKESITIYRNTSNEFYMVKFPSVEILKQFDKRNQSRIEVVFGNGEYHCTNLNDLKEFCSRYKETREKIISDNSIKSLIDLMI